MIINRHMFNTKQLRAALYEKVHIESYTVRSTKSDKPNGNENDTHQ